jgi:hypothetical protein
VSESVSVQFLTFSPLDLPLGPAGPAQFRADLRSPRDLPGNSPETAPVLFYPRSTVFICGRALPNSRLALHGLISVPDRQLRPCPPPQTPSGAVRLFQKPDGRDPVAHHPINGDNLELAPAAPAELFVMDDGRPLSASVDQTDALNAQITLLP